MVHKDKEEKDFRPIYYLVFFLFWKFNFEVFVLNFDGSP